MQVIFYNRYLLMIATNITQNSHIRLSIIDIILSIINLHVLNNYLSIFSTMKLYIIHFLIIVAGNFAIVTVNCCCWLASIRQISLSLNRVSCRNSSKLPLLRDTSDVQSVSRLQGSSKDIEHGETSSIRRPRGKTWDACTHNTKPEADPPLKSVS